MNVFMGYNPLVAKEVKITTWIKEFDGDSPVYPSFPNEGDCFVVFATDEDALTHNALSKKTYTNGEWADAEGGGGGDIDYPAFTKNEDTDPITFSCDKTYAECVAMCSNDIAENWFAVVRDVYEGEAEASFCTMRVIPSHEDHEDPVIIVSYLPNNIYYLSDGTITDESPE